MPGIEHVFLAFFVVSAVTSGGVLVAIRFADPVSARIEARRRARAKAVMVTEEEVHHV